MIPVKPTNVTWTDEQWKAIYEDNRNIIVSAGAGSGKTAVLTERVIRKLKDGVHVNELLILTFTKAAAGEMADRIRKKIKKIPELASELNLLDASYITTFDSFALSVVKRYHYLLNLSVNIGIIDSSIILLEKTRIMDELFLEYYKKQDPLFLKMIESFCTKDDSEIRNYFLSISNKLEQLSNKEEYLKSYLLLNFKEDKIEKDIQLYFGLIQEKILLIKKKVEGIGYIDSEFSLKLEESLSSLYETSGYDDLVCRLNIKLPMVPRGSDEELKSLKSDISDILKEIKGLAKYSSQEEIKTSILATQDIIKVMIEILLEFSNRVMEYKRRSNSYEFNDIAIMAIQLLKENKDVREELLTSFKEIMIDEYQDTNDLQEEFISMISNHNVYMVGDIKQSIYRFRNANPYIFKNKYDNYSHSNRDLKIDLNKNFRSRNEVLDNINTIFNLIMNDDIGGADYLTSHQMIFGNKAYLKDDVGHSNDMEIFRYNYDKELGYTKEEVEAFMIARDIKNKYENHYQVFDSDSGSLRDIRWDDFSIIMDRSSSFDLYKKVFNYFQIPLTLLKDEKMNDEDDIRVLSNLIAFIIKIKTNTMDTEFKYLFTSLMRSFLFNISDEVIFDYFMNNNYMMSELYQKCAGIVKNIDYLTPHQLLDQIITNFNYYECYIKLSNIHEGIVKVSKLREMAVNLEGLGYTIYDFSDYLVKILDNGYKIEYKVPDSGASSVNMMTIHKSKGLEYPICYFSGLYKSFNISDLKERFLLDKDYGLIVPYFNEGIGETIYKDLLKNKYLKEEISEKIRLFYVALTRAREKMIMVIPYTDEVLGNDNVTVLDSIVKSSYRTLADMINSVSFRIKSKYKDIDVNELKLSGDYKKVKSFNYREQIDLSNEKFIVQEVDLSKTEKEKKTFSKHTHEVINLEQFRAMELGTRVHEYLEFIDLKNPNYVAIDDKFIIKIIKRFLDTDILKDIKDACIYQEYEFMYKEDNINYHGIIDLMLEYSDHIDIIDYKLKNTKDDNYLKQLKGYQHYISGKTDKEIRLYLYSLLDGEFRSVN